MKRWRFLVLLVWLGVPALAYAKNLTMDDFAYGLEVNVPTGTAVAAVSLPEAVYKTAFRRDLGDMRVFNGNGEPVPHMLRYARSQVAEVPWRPLAFFPIPEGSDDNITDYSVYVRIEPDGAMMRMAPRTQSTTNTPGRTVLVDLGHMEIDLAELRLNWQPGTMNRLAFLSVEASDDLVQWKRLRSQAVISDIQHDGHRLTNDTIAFAPNHQRYLRLRQLNDGPPISMTAIQGRSRPEGGEAVRTFLTIEGKTVADTQGVFEYDTGGTFPVDRVNLLFEQPNSMADAQLASRNTPQGAWGWRYKGLFYRIDRQGTPMTSVPQPVTVSMDRHWRLTVDASESTIGRLIPRLEIGYRPHDLFFIVRGDGPFTLAFGSISTEPLKTTVAALVDSINHHHARGIERWVFPQGAPFELGGVQRITPQAQPLPTRIIVLWSILLAGVLIVAAMAWRLARRLKP